TFGCGQCSIPDRQVLNFILRQKIRDLAVNITPAVGAGDLSYSGCVVGMEAFTTEISRAEKLSIRVDLAYLLVEFAAGVFGNFRILLLRGHQLSTKACNFSVPLHYFEPRVDGVDTIVDRLQLSSLVDDVYRRC